MASNNSGAHWDAVFFEVPVGQACLLFTQKDNEPDHKSLFLKDFSRISVSLS